VGKKGDKAAKEGLAKDLYAQGKSLQEIAELLDVSGTSLGRWKADSKVPSEELDAWDQARRNHRSFLENLRALFAGQLAHIQSLPAKDRTPADYDALSKAAAIVRKWDDIERAEAAKDQDTGVEIDRPKLFLENLEWLALKLKDIDPEGLKVLARNFDALVIQFKAEHAQTS